MIFAYSVYQKAYIKRMLLHPMLFIHYVTNIYGAIDYSKAQYRLDHDTTSDESTDKDSSQEQKYVRSSEITLVESSDECSCCSMPKQQNLEYRTDMFSPITKTLLDINPLKNLDYTKTNRYARNRKGEIVKTHPIDDAFARKPHKYYANPETNQNNWHHDAENQDHYRKHMLQKYCAYLGLGGKKIPVIERALKSRINWKQYTQIVHLLKDEIGRLSKLGNKRNEIIKCHENMIKCCDKYNRGNASEQCRLCKDCNFEKTDKNSCPAFDKDSATNPLNQSNEYNSKETDIIDKKRSTAHKPNTANKHNYTSSQLKKINKVKETLKKIEEQPNGKKYMKHMQHIKDNIDNSNYENILQSYDYPSHDKEIEMKKNDEPFYKRYLIELIIIIVVVTLLVSGLLYYFLVCRNKQ